MNASQIPPGHALVRLDDLAAMLAGRAAAAPAPPSARVGATWEGLQAVIGLLTARLAGVAVDHGDVTGDVPAEAVSRTAVMLAGALLAALMPSDRAIELLRDLGLAAHDHIGGGTAPPAAKEG